MRLRRGFLTRWCGDSGRGERLARLSNPAVTLNDLLVRDPACILHFQHAIGPFPAARPNAREISLQQVVTVTGAVLFIGRLLSTA